MENQQNQYKRFGQASLYGMAGCATIIPPIEWWCARNIWGIMDNSDGLTDFVFACIDAAIFHWRKPLLRRYGCSRT